MHRYDASLPDAFAPTTGPRSIYLMIVLGAAPVGRPMKYQIRRTVVQRCFGKRSIVNAGSMQRLLPVAIQGMLSGEDCVTDALA